MILLLFKRDLLLAFRRGGGTLAGLAFALMAYAAFMFGTGADGARALPVIVLLACLMALPNLFERDEADGTLEQYLLQSVPLPWLLLAKLAAFWLTACLPLAVLSPLLMLMGGAEPFALLPALLPGTVALAAIGMLGAALTLGIPRAGVTQALILLPLYTPVLVFMAGGAPGLLWAFALASVPLACVLAAPLLRLAYD